MPSGVFKIINIPADKVSTVIADYELDSPDKIEKFEQPDGLWTVIATFSGEGEEEKDFGG